MKADRAEVSWDSGRSKWLVRIVVGEEVIRRHCDLPHGTVEAELRSAAQRTLADEGYEADGVPITIQNSQAA